jgi:predicted nucleic acid-binding protein
MPERDPLFFIDTSFYLSLYIADERNHEKAREVVEIVNSEFANPRYMTTDYVLIETLCTIWGRGEASPYQRRSAAARVAENIPKFSRITHLGQDLFRRTQRLFQERLLLEWSFVDCSSFILIQEMRRNRDGTKRKVKPQVLSFDGHFYSAQDEFGFEVFC